MIFRKGTKSLFSLVRWHLYKVAKNLTLVQLHGSVQRRCQAAKLAYED
jgi:hypothetical protein